jgi:hypothetical protein
VQHLKGGKETQHRDERCGWQAEAAENAFGEDEARDVREGRNKSGGEIRVNGWHPHGFRAERYGFEAERQLKRADANEAAQVRGDLVEIAVVWVPEESRSLDFLDVRQEGTTLRCA